MQPNPKIMQNIKYTCFLVFLLLFSACHWLETGRVSQKEINTASSWSKNDQYPSFEECERFESEDQKSCFSNIIVESIKTYLDQEELISNISIDEEVNLTIKIDKEGYFSLLNIEASSTLVESIPDLQRKIDAAVGSLPQAYPALKTNVGEYVDSKIVLPIRINAKKNS